MTFRVSRLTIVGIRSQAAQINGVRATQLDEPEETPDAENAAVIANPRGAVQFDDVSFQ